MECSIEGCSRKVLAKGLCASHYQTQRVARLREERRNQDRPCDQCGRSLAGKRPNARFCSRKCKEDWQLEAARSATTTRLAGRLCAWCEKPIDSRSGKAVTCSRECGIAFQNSKRNLAKLDAPARACEHCGADIPLLRKTSSQYCSSECKRASRSARQRLRNPGYMRQYLYGITPEQFTALLVAQDGRCAICRSETPGGKGGWHVDHDHATGAIRGLLCHSCNIALGNFADDAVRLRSAIEYLEARASS